MSLSTFELSIDYSFIDLNIKKVSSLMNWKEKWNRPMLNIKNIVILFLVSVECIAFVHVSKIGNLIEYNEKMCTVIYHLLCKKTKISSNDSHLDLYNLSHKFINILWHIPSRNLCNSRILKWTIQRNMKPFIMFY